MIDAREHPKNNFCCRSCSNHVECLPMSLRDVAGGRPGITRMVTYDVHAAFRLFTIGKANLTGCSLLIRWVNYFQEVIHK